LPSGLFGPRDFAPFLRLASARSLLFGAAARVGALGAGTAARGDCPVGLGSGAPTPLRPGNPIRDMAGFLWLEVGGRLAGDGRGARTGGSGTLADSRNIVQDGAEDSAPGARPPGRLGASASY
jgi:hypothetical protein